MNIEEAIKIVEGAGYSVISDQRLDDYYIKQDVRLNKLLTRAKRGNWVAAETLLSKVASAPGHVSYSKPLMDFMEFIALSLLDRRDITSEKTAGVRVKNPLLAAVIKTDSRRHYLLEEHKRLLKIRHDSHVENGTKKLINPVGLSEHLAESAGIDGESIDVDKYDKWIKSAKNIE